MTESPKESLPTLYDTWMDRLLEGDIPKEKTATCDSCVMCEKGNEPEKYPGYYFFPDVKCCSFIPILPNFRLGAILDDPDPSLETGRKTVRERIRSEISVSPFGVGRSREYNVKYKDEFQKFGTNRDLICPHFVAEGGGRCSIWKHRESTCTTWFCKFDRGKVGYQFWHSMHSLLSWLERRLAAWCIRELGLSSAELFEAYRGADKKISAELPAGIFQLNEKGDPETAKSIWGAWVGRKEEFYIEANRLVEKLSWDEVLKIGGPSARLYSRTLKEYYARMQSGDIPIQLKFGPFKKTEYAPGEWQITSYSNLDTLSISQDLLETLQSLFDGRSTPEILESLRSQGVDFNVDLFRQLVDWEVLVAD